MCLSCEFQIEINTIFIYKNDLVVGEMLNEHGGFWCFPLRITPNDLLSNSPFGAVAYEQIFQSCLSPLNLPDAHLHQNFGSLIF